LERIYINQHEPASLALAIAARRLNPNRKFRKDGFSDVQRYVIQYLERISSNFIFNNLTCHFSSSVHDNSMQILSAAFIFSYLIHSHVSGDAHVQLLCCSSITSMNKRYLTDTEAKEAYISAFYF
ncbi:hypothetical protein T12_13501, partial [Trichinella patagoniensis]